MIDFNKEKIYNLLKEIDAKNTILKNPNDIRRSDAFALLFKDCLRYSPERKCWYYYDGRVWISDKGGLYVNELCKIFINALIDYCTYEINEDDRFNYLNVALSWQKLIIREAIIKDARSVIPIDMSEFDKNIYLINLKNGTYDLKTGDFREHDPNDFITKIAPVEFDNNATCERWDSFILEIMSGDTEKVEFLQKALGYTLSGSTKQECMFLLYGESTRNGKGTLMESVLGVLGDYGATVRPETIASSNKSSNTHTEDLARLHGIRFANISEPSKSMLLNSALVKTLTGGDTINARFLHENSFQYKPQFKIYINTNYLPNIDDQTVFDSNRIYIIPFDRHFAPEEQDKNLKSFFSTDEAKSAILSWLIIGYYKSLSGFGKCKAVEDAIEKYRISCNPIYEFFTYIMIKEEIGKTPLAYAHKQYVEWASEENKPYYTIREFSKYIKKYCNVSCARVNGEVYKCLCY